MCFMEHYALSNVQFTEGITSMVKCKTSVYVLMKEIYLE